MGRATKHDIYFDRAAKVALKSRMNHRHGCVIVSDEGKIIAHGFNRDVDFMCHQHSIHAEVDAIGKLTKIMLQNIYSMYIVRISPRDAMLKYSKPCSNCEKLILKSGIKRIYYSTSYEYELENIKIKK